MTGPQTTNQSWQEAGPGVKRRLLADGEKLMAMQVRLEAGANIARHAHPHEQMSHLLEGHLTFYLGDEEREMQAGDTLLIPGGLEHAVLAHETCVIIDVFSPPREDLLAALR